MEDKNESLSVKIMEVLKDILPEGTAFIMVCGSSNEEDFGITSNMPDNIAIQFLKEAIYSIQNEPAVYLEDTNTLKN